MVGRGSEGDGAGGGGLVVARAGARRRRGRKEAGRTGEGGSGRDQRRPPGGVGACPQNSLRAKEDEGGKAAGGSGEGGGCAGGLARKRHGERKGDSNEEVATGRTVVERRKAILGRQSYGDEKDATLTRRGDLRAPPRRREGGSGERARWRVNAGHAGDE